MGSTTSRNTTPSSQNTNPLFGLCSEPEYADDDETPGQPFREGNLEAHVHEELGAWRVEVFSAKGARPLTWGEAIASLQKSHSAPLARLLTRVLKKAPFEAFYWECAPVSRSGKEKFEFVVMDAPSLRRIDANPQPFAEHLAEVSGQPVTRTFASLSGDAWLVAPANATGRPADYPHLAALLRGRAPSSQVQETWAELGRAIASQLQQHEMVWVSTNGDAVAWTHLRVCASPKYYKWSDYSRPQHGGYFMTPFFRGSRVV